jgi:hypothetical protein
MKPKPLIAASARRVLFRELSPLARYFIPTGPAAPGHRTSGHCHAKRDRRSREGYRSGRAIGRRNRAGFRDGARSNTLAEVSRSDLVTPSAPASAAPTEKDISVRAYQLWEQAGCPAGRDKEFYF